MVLELGNFGDFYTTLDEFASVRVSALVIDSIVQGSDKLLRIEPSPSLRAEIARTPRLKFAAFDDDRTPVGGSSPELVSALTKAGVIQMTSHYIYFNLPGDTEKTPLGAMERIRTPFGWLHIAVYRQKFQWTDMFTGYLARELKWNFAYVFVVVFGTAGTAWFAVREGLKPLRSAGRQAEQINLDSLDCLIEARSVPEEIIPFVEAINAALARLMASAKRMRRYTANAAHELRTPLAIMRARLEDEEEPTFKRDLLQDASKLQAVVEQMLVAARLTERQADLDQRLDLVPTIRSVVFDYMPLVIKCGRKIELEAPESPVCTSGNQRAIECVVANLIDNALRAEPLQGTVLVRIDASAKVEVIDHGDGIAMCDREMIFEPFWRKSGATPGTGLGLAIAKELMAKLGGRIWVEETPGGGATFKLSFKKAGEN